MNENLNFNCKKISNFILLQWTIAKATIVSLDYMKVFFYSWKKLDFFLSSYAWFTTLDVDQELCFILASFNNITCLPIFPTCIIKSQKLLLYCYWNLCELWELSFMQWIFRKNNIISVHTCKPDKRIYNLQLRCFWYPSHW